MILKKVVETPQSPVKTLSHWSTKSGATAEKTPASQNRQCQCRSRKPRVTAEEEAAAADQQPQPEDESQIPVLLRRSRLQRVDAARRQRHRDKRGRKMAFENPRGPAIHVHNTRSSSPHGKGFVKSSRRTERTSSTIESRRFCFQDLQARQFSHA